MRRRAILCLLFIATAVAVHLFCKPQAPALAADVSAADFKPGLKLSFAASNASAMADARVARLVALFVPAGSPACSAFGPGPFTATWDGVLTSHLREPQVFAADGNGDLKLKINDAMILDLHGDFSGHLSQPVQLKRGKNQIAVIYNSPSQGDASIRLMWGLTGQPVDPIPPLVFTHDANDPSVKDRTIVSAGREMVATMHCVNCHQSPQLTDLAMPELKQDAPSFANLGERLRPEWLEYWITNPKSLRPTATMPRMFHDSPSAATPEVDQRAIDIAAYLAPPSKQSGNNAIPSDATTIANGTRLFTGLGCVACHVAPDIQDSDQSLNRLPLKYVKAKFYPSALKAFLLNPQEHYAWIKMPNFHLSDEEATSVTAYLVSHAKDDLLPQSKNPMGDPAKGKSLVESVGCLNCHAADGKTPARAPAAIELSKADFTHGCLSDDGSKPGASADYSFTPEQRASIRAFAAKDIPTLAYDSLIDFKTRQQSILRCNACHSMDDHDDIWSSLDADIGQIEKDLPPVDAPPMVGDQGRPPMTWLGDRLRPDFIESQLSGTVPFKTRYWVTARMPAFPARAKFLAAGMAMDHGNAPVEPANGPADPKQAMDGQTLTGTTMAGCVQCHGVASQMPLAPFQGQAPNLSHVSTRLRHDYFTRWMRRPNYYLPGTKMPQFRGEDGTTSYKSILDGNADKQFEAVWHYVLSGEKIVPPG